jgi:hypothetical protein
MILENREQLGAGKARTKERISAAREKRERSSKKFAAAIAFCQLL